MAIYSSFLRGKFHGQRSLAGYSPWGHKESDTTERLNSKLNLGGDIDYNQPYVKILRFRVVPTEIFN